MNKFLVNILGASWQTSLIGIGQFFGIFGRALEAHADNDLLSKPNWDSVLVSLGVMVGFFFTRAEGVSSEQQKAHPSPLLKPPAIIIAFVLGLSLMFMGPVGCGTTIPAAEWEQIVQDHEDGRVPYARAVDDAVASGDPARIEKAQKALAQYDSNFQSFSNGLRHNPDGSVSVDESLGAFAADHVAGLGGWAGLLLVGVRSLIRQRRALTPPSTTPPST